MFAVANTKQLVADQIITPAQAHEIEARARSAMVAMTVNAVLCFGILAATGGLIFWLANAFAVAGLGGLMLLIGLWVLSREGDTYRMFGNAAALIGAGMLIGGATLELLNKAEDSAGYALALAGAGLAGLCVWRLSLPAPKAGFVLTALILAGVGLHITGFGLLLEQADLFGAIKAVFFLYAAALLALSGWFTDIRFVTALAIVPFAQALDTGSGYLHAIYVFYSPEPTLSILQMGLLIASALWLAQRSAERTARHARIAAVLAFVVANMCALVGSLWGDVIGLHLWGPGYFDFTEAFSETDDGTSPWAAYRAAREAFIDQAFQISENVYSVLWAIALLIMIIWAAHRNSRGLFNTAMTFAAIHAYTQFFESFADEALAYVIGGLAAIPLAWGLWRLNQRMAGR